jgi:predicted phage baseplate assembly protein
VLAESERLELADEPYDRPVSGRQIELAELYGRLEAGRWLIVAGERTDVEGTSGVQAAELVMLASVVHDVSTIEGRPLSDDPDAVDVTGIVKAGRLVPGDRVHSFIGLSTDLAYKYKRDTVRVYGNVVHATHGETRHEILGAGDATRPFLAFPLKQTPLTYVSAPTTSGVTSTLEVRVNEVRWDEADRFAGLEPTDWRFIVRTDDEGGTSVVFGNGGEGARPPTGTENISARYRSGIGRPGNVKARQITLLASRPLGVKDVVNPLPATGGTDREARDEARRNAPLAVLALDHLVSVQDYADFARTFGGIAKAASARLYAGRQALVHVTISGQGETRIDETSDVYRNLSLALHRFGDPTLPVKVGVRALRMLVVQARVRVADAYLWELVEPNVRAAMLVAFGFDRRELGQDVSASEVLRVMQAVPGVHHVDLDLLTSLPEDFTQDDLSALAGPSPPLAHHRRIPARLARVENGAIFPAELIVSSPLVPETLLLSEIER